MLSFSGRQLYNTRYKPRRICQTNSFICPVA